MCQIRRDAADRTGLAFDIKQRDDAFGCCVELEYSGNRFEGYTNDDASAKKILRDVFQPGDAWFRTGDLMRQDEHGYFYFVDRIGDTFRWKGENVATAEVEAVSCAFPGIAKANIYGASIPGADGRACMAALVINEALDLAAFRMHLLKHLPDYARPLFLRICKEMESTSTFKFTKNVLVREGYNPASTSDAIYFDSLNAAHSFAWTRNYTNASNPAR